MRNEKDSSVAGIDTVGALWSMDEAESALILFEDREVEVFCVVDDEVMSEESAIVGKDVDVKVLGVKEPESFPWGIVFDNASPVAFEGDAEVRGGGRGTSSRLDAGSEWC